MAGSNSSKKAKRAAGKSKATKTGRNPKTSGISRALDKLFGLVCLFTVLARVDFLTVRMKTPPALNLLNLPAILQIVEIKQ